MWETRRVTTLLHELEGQTLAPFRVTGLGRQFVFRQFLFRQFLFRQFLFRQFIFRQFIFRHRSIYSSDVRGFEEGWPLPPFPSVRSSLHSPPSFLSPSALSLTSRPPYCGYGIWGSALAPPVGPGGVRTPNGIWWILRFKNDVNTRVQAYIFLTESHTLSSKTSLHATLQYKCTVF